MTLRGVDRVLGVADVELPRHRQAEVGEQLRAELLVGGDLDGGVRGLAGQRRLDALLVLALADLDQAGVVQPHPGDVAGLGGADQRQRRGAERAAAGEIVEVLDRLGDVEVLFVARRDQLEDQRCAPPRRPRGRSPRTRSRRAPRPRPGGAPGRVSATSAGAPARFCSAIATCAISSPRRQSAVLEPLGERHPVLGDGGGEAGQVLEAAARQLRAVMRHRRVGAAVEIDGQPDQRLLGVDVRADVDGGRNDLHAGLLSGAA